MDEATESKLMIFFTADTHFGHKNIIKYCNRPFDSVEEMDSTIIDNWNKVVGTKDTVYHLGDFCTWKHGNYFERFRSYRNQLNGEIWLVSGNHDRRISPYIAGIKGISPLMEIRYNGRKIILCHFAMRVWNDSHFDSWHLYGHSHGTLDPIGKSWDVGVDNNNFTPISFNELGNIMSEQGHNFNWLSKLKGYDKEEFLEEKKKWNQ